MSFLHNLPSFWFYILAGTVIISAIGVVALKNIVHCAMFLALSFTAVAGIYILLEAEFLAAIQVLIYVGAVTVLILFAIMLSQKYSGGKVLKTHNAQNIPAIILILVFLSIIAKSLIANWGGITAGNPAGGSNVQALGLHLLTDYVLPFEVASVLLLVAMIGAIVIARREGGPGQD